MAGKGEDGSVHVRLDVRPSDRERLRRAARDRGLSMASYARMVVLEAIGADESRRQRRGS